MTNSVSAEYRKIYISHSYQAPTAPQPPYVRPIPQQSPNPTSTQSPAVSEQMNALKQLMTEMHQEQNQLIMTMSQAWPLITPPPPNKDRCHPTPYVQFHLLKGLSSLYKDKLEV